MKPLLLTLVATAIALTACQAGKYVGPKVSVSFGYKDASIGVVLWEVPEKPAPLPSPPSTASPKNPVLPAPPP